MEEIEGGREGERERREGDRGRKEREDVIKDHKLL